MFIILSLCKKIMFDSPACKVCQFQSPATKFLSNEEISKLSQNCSEIRLNKGDIIFKQGILSSNIVYLKKGVVKLHIEGPYKEQTIKITKGPAYLGIPTSFDKKYNRYSATVVEGAEACYINIDTFKQFVQNNGKFAYEIIVELCKNEINLFHKCISRAQKNARGRIADALIFFSEEIYEKDYFKLPMTRDELGNYVDTTRESVSRILAEFNNDGIIELKGKSVEIKNKEQLRLVSKTG